VVSSCAAEAWHAHSDMLSQTIARIRSCIRFRAFAHAEATVFGWAAFSNHDLEITISDHGYLKSRRAKQPLIQYRISCGYDTMFTFWWPLVEMVTIREPDVVLTRVSVRCY